MRTVWSKVASDHLDSIHNYISLDSIIYANRLIERIVTCVEQLNDFPLSGRAAPAYGDAMREIFEGSYRIFYKAFDEHVEIIAVVHGARLLDPKTFPPSKSEGESN